MIFYSGLIQGNKVSSLVSRLRDLDSVGGCAYYTTDISRKYIILFSTAQRQYGMGSMNVHRHTVVWLFYKKEGRLFKTLQNSGIHVLYHFVVNFLG